MLPIVQGSTKLGSLLCARLKGASGDMQSGGNKVDCGDFSNFTDDSEAKKVLKGRNKHCCNVLNSKVIVKSLRLYISSVFPTQPHKSQGMWKIFFFHSGTVPAWFGHVRDHLYSDPVQRNENQRWICSDELLGQGVHLRYQHRKKKCFMACQPATRMRWQTLWKKHTAQSFVPTGQFLGGDLAWKLARALSQH